MDCHRFREEVGEYPDRALSQDREVALEAHAAACPACAAQLGVFRAMRDGLRSLPRITASRDFDARLDRRLGRERGAAERGPLGFPSWAQWVAVAAAAAIVFVLGALLLRSDGGARRLGGELASGSTRESSIGVSRNSRTADGFDPERVANADLGEPVTDHAHLDAYLSEDGAALAPSGSARSYVIDRPSDLPLLLPGGVEGEAASAPISF